MHLWGIYAANANHIWAVGDYLTIIHYNGSTWEVQDSLPGCNDCLYTVSGTDENHVFVPRVGGKIRMYNGSNWSPWQQISSESGAPYTYYTNKIAVLKNKIWIAASYEDFGTNVGVILYNNGSYWNIPEPQNLEQGLCSIAAADENHIWAGGNRGGIFFSSGEAWTSQESWVETSGIARIRHMHAVNKNEVWAVGDPENGTGSGIILKYDGTKWNKYNCGLSEHFFGVATYDGSKIWVVGDNGTIIFGKK